jgi:DNA-binding CsgD family transcriptional regulator
MFRASDRFATAISGSLGLRAFEGPFARACSSPDLQILEAEIKKFADALDFERYGLLLIHDDFSSDASCVVLGAIDNVPPGYQASAQNSDQCRADPVQQHCKRSSVPCVYGPETYAAAGQRLKWEHQAQFGYAFGIASVFHLPRDRHVLFGLDRVAPLPDSKGDLFELASEIHLFGTLILTAATSLLSTNPALSHSAEQLSCLSPREHECLQWAAEGKTAWETGMILSIAEATVVKILASAIRKLDCANKPQAVVKALRLRLIH